MRMNVAAEVEEKKQRRAESAAATAKTRAVFLSLSMRPVWRLLSFSLRFQSGALTKQSSAFIFLSAKMKAAKRFNIVIDYLYLDFSSFVASTTEVQPF